MHAKHSPADPLPPVVAALALLALTGAAAAADSQPCSKVTAEQLAIPGLVLTGAAMQEAGDGLPRACVLTGKVNDRTGADGRRYAIDFELRLPADWNGRFLDQGNGGADGEVKPAIGGAAQGVASGAVPALARGFAVLSSDSGHSGADPANASRGLAAGVAFGLDPQARRDYGYAADMTLAPIAKAILAAHYGRKPDFSYYGGCSNGGRHGMVAAARMPDQYDGFLVGNPGFDLPRAALQHAWDAQAFVKADPDIRKSITKDDAALDLAKNHRGLRQARRDRGWDHSQSRGLPEGVQLRQLSRARTARAPTACPRPRSRR